MCSIHGLLTIEIMGFGWLLVNGLSLVPLPPAMITAFTSPPLSSFRHLLTPKSAPSTSRNTKLGTQPRLRSCAGKRSYISSARSRPALRYSSAGTKNSLPICPRRGRTRKAVRGSGPGDRAPAEAARAPRHASPYQQARRPMHQEEEDAPRLRVRSADYSVFWAGSPVGVSSSVTAAVPKEAPWLSMKRRSVV